MRARNLKPSLFANEVLGASDPYLTILFEGLWCLADREGRVEDRPLKIKGQVFPYRNFNEARMNALLNALTEGEEPFIRRYQVEGKRIIQVVNFLEHQSPHSTEKDSQLPPEPQHDQEVTKPQEDNGSLTQQHPNFSEEGVRSQESGVRNQESGILSSENEIFTYWQAIHSKPRAQFTIERKRKVRERLKDSTLEEIKTAIDGCRASPMHQGQNERGTVYDDLELICRTRTHLERFIEHAKLRKKGNGVLQTIDQKQADDLANNQHIRRPPPKPIILEAAK